jgi:hypothetical protein
MSKSQVCDAAFFILSMLSQSDNQPKLQYINIEGLMMLLQQREATCVQSVDKMQT